MIDRPANAPPRFWVLIGGVPNGPHDAELIASWLRAGELARETPCCLVGGSDWETVGVVFSSGQASPGEGATTGQFAAFSRVLERGSEPATAVTWPAAVEARHQNIEPAAPVASPPSWAWNPTAVAWLGVAFSPLWAGIMAAVNARRLGLTTPWWRPVGIAVVACGVDIWRDLAGHESYAASLGIYLAGLLLIWLADLRPQSKAFAAAGPARPGGSWVVPCLVGLPLAACVLLAFVVAPLLPLQPREVCERLMKANSEKELKRYSTLNLWPALVALSEGGGDGKPPEWELTDERPAEPALGGHLVGFRVATTGPDAFALEGVFHLVQRDGAWKAEEMFLLSVDGNQLEQPLAVSQHYREIIRAGREGAGAKAPAGGK